MAASTASMCRTRLWSWTYSFKSAKAASRFMAVGSRSGVLLLRLLRQVQARDLLELVQRPLVVRLAFLPDLDRLVGAAQRRQRHALLPPRRPDLRVAEILPRVLLPPRQRVLPLRRGAPRR